MARRREYVEVDNDSNDEGGGAPEVDNFDDSGDESDLNAEVVRMDTNVVIPPKDAGLEQYQKALEAAQLSILEMKVELRKARKENVTLAENQPRRRLKGIPKDVSLHDKTIKDLGRQYAIMISPWVDNASFGHAKRPDIDPMKADSFKDKLSQHQASIAELYDFVPENLHGLMEKHSHFADLFRAHVNAMRSTAAHSIREKASRIFPVDGSLITGELDRATQKELQDLITIDGEYKAFPRILFPDELMRKPDCFRSDTLAKVLRVLFFGPSSLKTSHVPRPKTNAEIWKITEVTAGSIAFAAILSRFLLSPDTEFSPKGNKTNIDYMADFNLYKRMLLSDSPRMKSVFEWYNKRIFSKNKKEIQNAPTSDDQEESFEDLLRAIDSADLNDNDTGAAPQEPPAPATVTGAPAPVAPGASSTGTEAPSGVVPDPVELEQPGRPRRQLKSRTVSSRKA